MDSANNQCVNGQHYIFDSSAKNFVNVGPCADLHEQSSEDTGKAQVVNAAQQALQSAKGQPQSGFGMEDTVFPSLGDLKSKLVGQ